MADVELTSSTPRIEVSPRESLRDEVVGIRLAGFKQHELVTLHARMRDDTLRWWASRTIFRTDAHGTIDVGSQAPVAGSYDGVDPMGFLWSMFPEPNAQTDSPFRKAAGSRSTIELTAAVDGEPVATADLVRLHVAPDVIRTPVRDNGLVGTFFEPSGQGPFPAIIVVGGSEGGLFEGTAALFASHGYAAFALAYFGVEHLPAELIRIPLEYFETAIHWVQAQSSVRAEKLALRGGSRGGELVLLLAATYSEVKAVISYMPGSIVYGAATKAQREVGDPQPAWTYRGEAVPFLPSRRDWPLDAETQAGQPLALTPLFLRTLEDVDQMERATIPVERIGGPVLLISGKDDAMWPSSMFAERAMERMAELGHPYPHQHFCYEGAGHAIGFPYRPTTITHGGRTMGNAQSALGGTAKGNAFAQIDSWSRVLEFLDTHLK